MKDLGGDPRGLLETRRRHHHRPPQQFERATTALGIANHHHARRIGKQDIACDGGHFVRRHGFHRGDELIVDGRRQPMGDQVHDRTRELDAGLEVPGISTRQ